MHNAYWYSDAGEYSTLSRACQRLSGALQGFFKLQNTGCPHRHLQSHEPAVHEPCSRIHESYRRAAHYSRIRGSNSWTALQRSLPGAYQPQLENALGALPASSSNARPRLVGRIPTIQRNSALAPAARRSPHPLSRAPRFAAIPSLAPLPPPRPRRPPSGAGQGLLYCHHFPLIQPTNATPMTMETTKAKTGPTPPCSLASPNR
jgi:hypothetical protein